MKRFLQCFYFCLFCPGIGSTQWKSPAGGIISMKSLRHLHMFLFIGYACPHVCTSQLRCCDKTWWQAPLTHRAISVLASWTLSIVLRCVSDDFTYKYKTFVCTNNKSISSQWENGFKWLSLPMYSVFLNFIITFFFGLCVERRRWVGFLLYRNYIYKYISIIITILYIDGIVYGQFLQTPKL